MTGVLNVKTLIAAALTFSLTSTFAYDLSCKIGSNSTIQASRTLVDNNTGERLGLDADISGREVYSETLTLHGDLTLRSPRYGESIVVPEGNYSVEGEGIETDQAECSVVQTTLKTNADFSNTFVVNCFNKNWIASGLTLPYKTMIFPVDCE